MEEKRGLRAALIRLDDRFTAVCNFFSNLSGVCLVLIMLLAFFDVILSKVFQTSGIKGQYEMIEVLSIPVLYLAMAYTHLTRGQIQIDLLKNKFPKPIQTAITYFSYLLGVAMSLFMAWHGFRYAMTLRSKHTTTSGALGITEWPVCLLMVFGLVVLALAYLLTMIRQAIHYDPYPNLMAPDTGNDTASQNDLTEEGDCK